MKAEQATKRLGERLLERRLVTARQLDHALMEQRKTKEFLGTVLVRLGVVQPQALLEVLSEQYKLPHGSLRPEAVDWALVKQFPASAFSEGRCLPIHADDETVTVAIANPLDAWALHAIERVAGLRRVQAILVLEQELRDAMLVYHQRVLRALTSELTP